MYPYRVKVEKKDAAVDEQPIAFDFTSHDDLGQILERLKGKSFLPADEAVAFAVGLKIFSSIMIGHRKEEPFVEFSEHFGAFMRKLKSM